MNEPIEGIEAQPTEPSRADRAAQATRMMEQAWAADAAAREAARAQQPRPAGFSGASEFEPLASRTPAQVTGQPPQQATPAETPATSARALAAEAARGTPAQREFTAATRELESAQQARQQADQELARRLSRIGPGLTEAQRTDFTTRYAQQHAPVYERERQATERAARVLQERGPELRQAAETPEGARTLSNGLAALAQSTRAVEALQFAGQVVAGGGAAAQNLQAAPNFGRDVLERGLPTAAAVLAGQGLERNDLVREVTRLAMPFVPAVTGGLQGYRGHQELQALVSGNMDAVRNLATRWEQSSPVMRAAGIAGAGIGLANAGRSIAQGESAAQVVEALGRGLQSTAEVASNLTRAFSTGLRAAGTATALARLAPGLGLAANAASLVHNGSQVMRTGNAGYAIAAGGDAVATLGSLISLFPPTAVPGAAVNALGQVVSAVGDLTANHITDARSRQAQIQQLVDGGMERRTAETMMGNLAGVQELARQGFSPQQIQALAGSRPELLARPADLQVFGQTAAALGVDPAAATNLLQSLSRRDLSTLTAGLAQARTTDDRRAFLEQMLSMGGSESRLAAIRQLLGR